MQTLQRNIMTNILPCPFETKNMSDGCSAAVIQAGIGQYDSTDSIWSLGVQASSLLQRCKAPHVQLRPGLVVFVGTVYKALCPLGNPSETGRFYHKDCKPSPLLCKYDGVHWHLILHGSMQLVPPVHEKQLGTSARVFGVLQDSPLHPAWHVLYDRLYAYRHDNGAILPASASGLPEPLVHLPVLFGCGLERATCFVRAHRSYAILGGPHSGGAPGSTMLVCSHRPKATNVTAQHMKPIPFCGEAPRAKGALVPAVCTSGKTLAAPIHEVTYAGPVSGMGPLLDTRLVCYAIKAVYTSIICPRSE
eukprot:6483022-Amphidinium_carterae.1